MAAYADTETLLLTFRTLGGDERGPAYYPVEADWRGSPIQGLRRLAIEWDARSYEPRITVEVAGGDAAQVLDMQNEGVRITDTAVPREEPAAPVASGWSHERRMMLAWLGELRTAQQLVACGNIAAADKYLRNRIAEHVAALSSAGPATGAPAAASAAPKHMAPSDRARCQADGLSLLRCLDCGYETAVQHPDRFGYQCPDCPPVVWMQAQPWTP